VRETSSMSPATAQNLRKLAMLIPVPAPTSQPEVARLLFASSRSPTPDPRLLNLKPDFFNGVASFWPLLFFQSRRPKRAVPVSRLRPTARTSDRASLALYSCCGNRWREPDVRPVSYFTPRTRTGLLALFVKPVSCSARRANWQVFRARTVEDCSNDTLYRYVPCVC
jgi:hypothetical protein